MSKTEKILILGGTKEAAELAMKLVKDGHEVITSLAGRTKRPAGLAGTIRIGGFSNDNKTGAQGLAEYITSNHITKLIDATHPFAETISDNAKQAAKWTNVNLEIISRPPWQRQEGDHWLETKNLDEACNLIPSGARVLLALGSQHISIFKKRSDVYFLVRMIDPPEEDLSLPDYELILGRPSDDWRIERDMLKKHKISHIVCRNSGGTGAYEKIEAARKLGITVIMITRA